MKIWTATKQYQSLLRNEKMWGFPAYVLDYRLQDRKKIPKWDPRKRLGQYMGKSPNHASYVGLIRNLETRFVSPQFHVIYDNIIHTMMDGYEENNVIRDHIWSVLA